MKLLELLIGLKLEGLRSHLLLLLGCLLLLLLRCRHLKNTMISLHLGLCGLCVVHLLKALGLRRRRLKLLLHKEALLLRLRSLLRLRGRLCKEHLPVGPHDQLIPWGYLNGLGLLSELNKTLLLLLLRWLLRCLRLNRLRLLCRKLR